MVVVVIGFGRGRLSTRVALAVRFWGVWAVRKGHPGDPRAGGPFLWTQRAGQGTSPCSLRMKSGASGESRGRDAQTW